MNKAQLSKEEVFELESKETLENLDNTIGIVQEKKSRKKKEEVKDSGDE